MYVETRSRGTECCVHGIKDENGRKQSKTILQYRKIKAVGLGYFYILAIKEYKNN
jgi:hypothetical protein